LRATFIVQDASKEINCLSCNPKWVCNCHTNP